MIKNIERFTNHFLLQMCLFRFFFILQKSCNIISLGIFFVHFTLYKSEKYMFCTLLICYQFYDLNYSRQERGDYRFIFGFSYFLFLVKGDLMGWVGGGLRMRETYIKRISFYFDRSQQLHIQNYYYNMTNAHININKRWNFLLHKIGVVIVMFKFVY